MALSGNADKVLPIVAELNYPLNGQSTGGGIEVSGASAGQTVKIAEVDANGVPTAWEPVDFPKDGLPGKDGQDGYAPQKGVDYFDGKDGKSAYETAKEGGYTGTEGEFAKRLANGTDEEAVNTLIGTAMRSVKTYGAKGDGVTDDTDAFIAALADKQSVVYVPGGTYLLSKTIVITENSCLELSQDTLLKFTQTTGNCIEMRGSAVLRGNHGIVDVPYGFSGNAVSIDTALDGYGHMSIPPYKMQCPTWKRQRFVYDLNVVMANADGKYRPMDGKCTGTAIYMSAYNDPNRVDEVPFLWGIVMSGIRIAGGFSYGVLAENFDGVNEDDAWNHELRIEAIIEGCEVGVSLVNCNTAHLDVTVQPTVATNGTKYAKCGIRLEDAKWIDATGSFVWDWKSSTTLLDASDENQHIAMYGDCRGLVLSDHRWHNAASAFTDVRTEIYTDTPSNLEKMTILQEPITRWFRPKDGKPYFFDGLRERALMLETDKFSAEQAEFIHPADGFYTYDEDYTNLVNGYTDGCYLVAGGKTSPLAGYVTTDFIKIDGADSHTYRIGGKGIKNDSYGYCRIAWYDGEKNLKGDVMIWNKIGSSQYYPVIVDDDSVAIAFETNANVAAPKGAEWFRVTAEGQGENLIVTIDDPLDYKAIWHGEPKKLDDSIHAKNDWNASEGEVGYIANRTHYETLVELVPETSVEVDSEGFGVLMNAVEYNEGDRFQITVNGTVYNAEAMTTDGVCIIVSLDASGVPVVMLASGALSDLEPSMMVVISPVYESTTIALSIMGMGVKPLSETYLPDTAKTYIIKVTAEEWAAKDSENSVVMSQPYDSFIDLLYAGGNVCIDLRGAYEDGTFFTDGFSKVIATLFAAANDNNTQNMLILRAVVNTGYNFDFVDFRFTGVKTPPTA